MKRHMIGGARSYYFSNSVRGSRGGGAGAGGRVGAGVEAWGEPWMGSRAVVRS